MNIVMLTGSPHRYGTSSLLADEFTRGALDAGHHVSRFDPAFEDIKPCLGCGQCRTNGACVRLDAMGELIPSLIAADGIVFVTPVYYFGMPAQLKAVVDRFYFPESRMMGGKRTALLATAYNPSQDVMDALTVQYHKIQSYMGWIDAGMVLACGCGVREDIEKSGYPQQAYALGRRFFTRER